MSCVAALGITILPPTRPKLRSATVASHELVVLLLICRHLCDLLVQEELALSLSHPLQERRTVSVVAHQPNLANPGSFLRSRARWFLLLMCFCWAGSGCHTP